MTPMDPTDADTAGRELHRAVERMDTAGFAQAEALAKRGRTRHLELALGERVASFHHEMGWAARASDDRRSFHGAWTGRPPEAGMRKEMAWPEADGEPFELPEPPTGGAAGAPWREPEGSDATLVSEREGFALLDRIASELASELPAATLVSAALDDGFSETAIVSSRGVDAAFRSRAAHLRVEAIFMGERPVRAVLERSEREARNFRPEGLARRLADRLSVAATGTAPDRDRAEMLLAPPVVAQLLSSLMPLWVGPGGFALAGRLEDRRGRFASDRLTLVDDGRLPGGVLSAPVDGEGMPTRAVTLVEAGAYRQPLLTWRESKEVRRFRGRASGCARRPGWRDLPVPGPSQLYVQPDPETSVGDLVAGVARGYYLLDVDGGVRLDADGGRLAVPVVGFRIERGQATQPMAGAWLVAGVGQLLRGIDAVGRDLTWTPIAGVAGGLIGAPTLSVGGLELRDRPV